MFGNSAFNELALIRKRNLNNPIRNQIGLLDIRKITWPEQKTSPTALTACERTVGNWMFSGVLIFSIAAIVNDTSYTVMIQNGEGKGDGVRRQEVITHNETFGSIRQYDVTLRLRVENHGYSVLQRSVSRDWSIATFIQVEK